MFVYYVGNEIMCDYEEDENEGSKLYIYIVQGYS